MDNELKRLHAIIHGRVQGVSFRYDTTLKANELHIVGWVQNLGDGSVEVVAEGTQEALEQFESWLYEGSPHAKVEEITITWEEATVEFDDFRTVYYRDLED